MTPNRGDRSLKCAIRLDQPRSDGHGARQGAIRDGAHGPQRHEDVLQDAQVSAIKGTLPG